MEVEITITKSESGFHATCRGKYALSPVSPENAAAEVAAKVFGNQNISMERLPSVEGKIRFKAELENPFTIAVETKHG